jgi:hypothetical protein
MSERNRAIARRYFEELLAGDVVLADEIIAEHIDFYGPDYWGEPIHGREGFKGFVAYLRAAFLICVSSCTRKSPTSRGWQRASP